MTTLNVTTHTDGFMTQIKVTGSDTARAALLTRFKGSRTWSVNGRNKDEEVKYGISCHNGGSFSFRKSDALRMAERFVKNGWEFL